MSSSFREMSKDHTKEARLVFLAGLSSGITSDRDISKMKALQMRVLQNIRIFEFDCTSNNANRELLCGLSLLLQALSQNSDSRAKVIVWTKEFANLFRFK